MGVITNPKATGVYSDAFTVYADDLGARGDGVTDDTGALTNILNGQYQTVYLRPGGIYPVNALKIANGVSLVAEGGRDYTAIHSYMTPKLISAGGTTSILDLNNQIDTNYGRAVSLRGIIIDGTDSTRNGISAGSTRLNLTLCYITNCLYGIGGATSGGGSSYTRVLQAIGCVFTNCTTAGISNLIDSVVSCTGFASCGICIKIISGGNHSSFDTNRFEWTTTGELIQLNGSGGAVVDRNTFSNCQFDRGALAGITSVNTTNTQMIGCQHSRPCASNTGALGQRSHIFVDNSTSGFIVSAAKFDHGVDDGGGGSDTPTYGVEFNGVVTNFVMNACDLTNAFASGGQAMNYNSGRNSTQVPGIRLSGNIGLEDYGPTQDRSTTITGGGSNTYAFSVATQFPVATFSRRAFVLTVWVNNSTSGTTAAARFTGTVIRGSGSASLAFSAAYGEVGTAGRIGIGSGTWINFANSSVATDGSTWTMTATNANATDSMIVEYKISTP